MEHINKLCGVPLVLHGGSGIPDFQIKKAIERGTAKINVNTECQQYFTKAVREVLNNDLKVYDPRKYIVPGMKGIKSVVREKCEVFRISRQSFLTVFGPLTDFIKRHQVITIFFPYLS